MTIEETLSVLRRVLLNQLFRYYVNENGFQKEPADGKLFVYEELDLNAVYDLKKAFTDDALLKVDRFEQPPTLIGYIKKNSEFAGLIVNVDYGELLLQTIKRTNKLKLLSKAKFAFAITTEEVTTKLLKTLKKNQQLYENIVIATYIKPNLFYGLGLTYGDLIINPMFKKTTPKCLTPLVHDTKEKRNKSKTKKN